MAAGTCSEIPGSTCAACPSRALPAEQAILCLCGSRRGLLQLTECSRCHAACSTSSWCCCRASHIWDAVTSSFRSGWTRCAAAPRRVHLHLAAERSDETLTLGVVQECHTVMRTRTMWATVPLLLFFTCQMMGQSTHYNWLDCSQEALVQQICYLQVTPRAAAAPLSSTPRC
jgi:hypothetical protein